MPARPISLDALGYAIRDLRKERGLTQEALCELAGIHVTYLSGIERGKQNPTIGMLNAIAAAFDVATLELLSAADSRASPTA